MDVYVAELLFAAVAALVLLAALWRTSRRMRQTAPEGRARAQNAVGTEVFLLILAVITIANAISDMRR